MACVLRIGPAHGHRRSGHGRRASSAPPSGRPGGCGAGLRGRVRRRCGRARCSPGAAPGVAGDRDVIVRAGRAVARLPGAGSGRRRIGRRRRNHRRCGYAAAQGLRRAQLRALRRLCSHRRARRAASRAQNRLRAARPSGGSRVHRLVLGACVDVALVSRAHAERHGAFPRAARQPALEQCLRRDAGQGRRHHGDPNAEDRQSAGVADRAGSAGRSLGSEVPGPGEPRRVHSPLDGSAAPLGGRPRSRGAVLRRPGAPLAVWLGAAARQGGRESAA